MNFFTYRLFTFWIGHLHVRVDACVLILFILQLIQRNIYLYQIYLEDHQPYKVSYFCALNREYIFKIDVWCPMAIK